MTAPCPHCWIADKTQHSLREGGTCDGLRTGKLVRNQDGRIVRAEGVAPRPRSRRASPAASTHPRFTSLAA